MASSDRFHHTVAGAYQRCRPLCGYHACYSHYCTVSWCRHTNCAKSAPNHKKLQNTGFSAQVVTLSDNPSYPHTSVRRPPWHECRPDTDFCDTQTLTLVVCREYNLWVSAEMNHTDDERLSPVLCKHWLVFVVMRWDAVRLSWAAVDIVVFSLLPQFDCITWWENLWSKDCVSCGAAHQDLDPGPGSSGWLVPGPLPNVRHLLGASHPRFAQERARCQVTVCSQR